MSIDAERVLLTRDARLCACGHKSVSHGSFIAGEPVAIGHGPCGVDRDPRNALTGWLGDPCRCPAFEEASVENDQATSADGLLDFGDWSFA